MPFLSLTRLHLRAWRHLPAFLIGTAKAARQAQQSSGFIIGALSADLRHRTFWTLTIWRSDADLRAYLLAGAHRDVMPKLAKWCDEASVARRDHTGHELPTIEDALRYMQLYCRTSRVPQASPEHAAGETVPDARPPLFLRRLPPIPS